MTGTRMRIIFGLVAVMAISLLLIAFAKAQQTTFRDANGRISTTVTTDSNGTRPFATALAAPLARPPATATARQRSVMLAATGTATARDTERRSSADADGRCDQMGVGWGVFSVVRRRLDQRGAACDCGRDPPASLQSDLLPCLSTRFGRGAGGRACSDA